MNHYWWQTGIIYQVYPRSFQDSNNDGIGDLQGIIRRLDYLQWLCIKAIWISPVYPSPMYDYGYDITDYRNIDPMKIDWEKRNSGRNKLLLDWNRELIGLRKQGRH